MGFLPEQSELERGIGLLHMRETLRIMIVDDHPVVREWRVGMVVSRICMAWVNYIPHTPSCRPSTSAVSCQTLSSHATSGRRSKMIKCASAAPHWSA